MCLILGIRHNWFFLLLYLQLMVDSYFQVVYEQFLRSINTGILSELSSFRDIEISQVIEHKTWLTAKDTKSDR